MAAKVKKHRYWFNIVVVTQKRGHQTFQRRQGYRVGSNVREVMNKAEKHISGMGKNSSIDDITIREVNEKGKIVYSGSIHCHDYEINNYNPNVIRLPAGMVPCKDTVYDNKPKQLDSVFPFCSPRNHYLTSFPILKIEREFI